MDTEVLNAIKETNASLNRISILVIVGGSIWIIKSVVAILNHGGAIMKRSLREKASALYEVGDYEKLLKKSREMITLLPNNPEGYFWKARALKELGLIGDDLNASIHRLSLLAPDWKENWMDEYISEKSIASTNNGDKRMQATGTSPAPDP